MIISCGINFIHTHSAPKARDEFTDWDEGLFLPIRPPFLPHVLLNLTSFVLDVELARGLNALPEKRMLKNTRRSSLVFTGMKGGDVHWVIIAMEFP